MTIVKGIKAKLIEVSEIDANDIITIRNNSVNNKFLSSSREISEDEQKSWIQSNRKRKDNYYFKITNFTDSFFGTISIYNIKNGEGEFGRFISMNPLLAVEAEYLIMKFGFEELSLNKIYCKTILENKSVWNQHYKFGFVDEGDPIFDESLKAYLKIQYISKDIFLCFDYRKILGLISRFK